MPGEVDIVARCNVAYVDTVIDPTSCVCTRRVTVTVTAARDGRSGNWRDSEAGKDSV